MKYLTIYIVNFKRLPRTSDCLLSLYSKQFHFLLQCIFNVCVYRLMFTIILILQILFVAIYYVTSDQLNFAVNIILFSTVFTTKFNESVFMYVLRRTFYLTRYYLCTYVRKGIVQCTKPSE